MLPRTAEYPRRRKFLGRDAGREKRDCNGIAASSAAEDMTGELKMGSRSVGIDSEDLTGSVGTGLRQYRPIEALGLDTKTSEILKGYSAWMRLHFALPRDRRCKAQVPPRRPTFRSESRRCTCKFYSVIRWRAGGGGGGEGSIA